MASTTSHIDNEATDFFITTNSDPKRLPRYWQQTPLDDAIGKRAE
jgi:hypothetical protein